MAAVEPLDQPDGNAPWGTEPAVPDEPPDFQSVSPERKPGAVVGLPLRRRHDQLPAEVDGSTEMAAADSLREAGRDVAQAPRWHRPRLPDQGSSRRGCGSHLEHMQA